MRLNILQPLSGSQSIIASDHQEANRRYGTRRVRAAVTQLVHRWSSRLLLLPPSTLAASVRVGVGRGRRRIHTRSKSAVTRLDGMGWSLLPPLSVCASLPPASMARSIVGGASAAAPAGRSNALKNRRNSWKNEDV